MAVFFRYLFAYRTSNQDAETIAQTTFNIMIKHAYLSTTLVLDSGSNLSGSSN